MAAVKRKQNAFWTKYTAFKPHFADVEEVKIDIFWTLFGGVLSVFQGLPVTALRLIKYIMSFGFLFARFDLKIIPSTTLIRDKAYVGYVSLVAVEHTYNNSIVLTFVAFLLAKREVAALTAPRPLSSMGHSCTFPHLKNMVRTVLAVHSGAVAPRPTCQQSRLQWATDFFVPKLDQPIALDSVKVLREETSPSHERATKRWHLRVLLVRNPSLQRHRKQAGVAH